MLPLEFRVTGTPISHQSHNKPRLRAWREQVAAEARAAVLPGSRPVEVDVALLVVYYYKDGPAQIPDVDNMLKPIQDALIGIAYSDDRQVTDATCCKRDMDGDLRVGNWTAVLAEGFMRGDDFIHISVQQAPNRKVPRR